MADTTKLSKEPKKPVPPNPAAPPVDPMKEVKDLLRVIASDTPTKEHFDENYGVKAVEYWVKIAPYVSHNVNNGKLTLNDAGRSLLGIA